MLDGPSLQIENYVRYDGVGKFDDSDLIFLFIVKQQKLIKRLICDILF